jgi:hypothetical protein
MRTFALLVLLAGCGKSKAECKAEAGDLVKFLNAMDRGPEFLIDDDMHMVVRGDLSRTKLVVAPIVIVKPTSITFAGDAVTDANDLATRMSDAAAKWNHAVNLEIDGDVKWGTIAAVMAAAATSGFDHVNVVFARPRNPAVPPRSKIDDEIDRIAGSGDPGSRAAEFGSLMSDVIASCKPIGKLFSEVARPDVPAADHVIAGLGPALIECNCDLDLPSLRSGLWRLLAVSKPTSVLELVIARDGQPVEQPASRPWYEANKHLVSGVPMWPVAR